MDQKLLSSAFLLHKEKKREVDLSQNLLFLKMLHSHSPVVVVLLRKS